MNFLFSSIVVQKCEPSNFLSRASNPYLVAEKISYIIYFFHDIFSDDTWNKRESFKFIFTGFDTIRTYSGGMRSYPLQLTKHLDGAKKTNRQRAFTDNISNAVFNKSWIPSANFGKKSFTCHLVIGYPLLPSLQHMEFELPSRWAFQGLSTENEILILFIALVIIAFGCSLGDILNARWSQNCI